MSEPFLSDLTDRPASERRFNWWLVPAVLAVLAGAYGWATSDRPGVAIGLVWFGVVLAVVTGARE